MATTNYVQINLKLTPELLESIDAAVARAGNSNRSDWLRATITSACEGRMPSLPAGGGSKDLEARSALVALKDRIDDLEGDAEMNYRKLMMLTSDLTDQVTEIKQTHKEVTDKKAAAFDKWSQRLKEADQRNVQVDNFNETFLKS